MYLLHLFYIKLFHMHQINSLCQFQKGWIYVHQAFHFLGLPLGNTIGFREGRLWILWCSPIRLLSLSVRGRARILPEAPSNFCKHISCLTEVQRRGKLCEKKKLSIRTNGIINLCICDFATIGKKQSVAKIEIRSGQWNLPKIGWSTDSHSHKRIEVI